MFIIRLKPIYCTTRLNVIMLDCMCNTQKFFVIPKISRKNGRYIEILQELREGACKVIIICKM